MAHMKLHLGCAQRYLKGFFHVDAMDNSIIDKVSPLHDLSWLPDETVDEIYCSHALEYYDRQGAEKVLKEWFRVLKNYGTVFISVPNFAELVKVYQMTDDLESIIGPLFGRWPNGPEYIYHKSVFDETTLKSLLMKCGFSSVYPFDPFEYLHSQDPNYDDFSLAFYPHFDRTGIQISLCLKATKSLE